MSATSDQGEAEPRAKREFKPIRPHRKSRNGCQNCKKRKIKCDESRPSCQNCGAFSISCDYTSTAPASYTPHHRRLGEAGYPNDQALLPPLRRGRPRKAWPPAPATAIPAVADPPDAISLLGPSVLQPDELALLDTYLAFVRARSTSYHPVAVVNRVIIPQLGASHRYLMHLILGFAALHLAHLHPASSSFSTTTTNFTAIAYDRLARGLRGVARALPHLDAATCHPAFVAACFVCFYAFARGPRAGEFLLFSNNNADDDEDAGQAAPPFMPLIRGVRCIVEAVGGDAIFAGPLGACTDPGRADWPPVGDRVSWGDWAGPLGALRAVVVGGAAGDGGGGVGEVGAALDNLAVCFRGAFGDGEGAPPSGSSNEQIVLAWFYRVSMLDAFVRDLRRKRPLALLVYAYFAVLLKLSDGVWFMRGWAEHILAGIWDEVGEGYRGLMEWPMREVGMWREQVTEQD